MFSYINFDKICLTSKGEFSQNVNKNFKVFEINELSTYLLNYSIELLKNKYRPKKQYAYCDREILDYHYNQIYLNPYAQVLKIIKYVKKSLNKLKVYQVYKNCKKSYNFYETHYEYLNMLNKNYYYYLGWIYPYRNSIYFDDIRIKKEIVDVTQLDPRYLESIYNLPQNSSWNTYNRKVNEELNMDKNHPFIGEFRKNLIKFHNYLVEFQMILPPNTLDLCWKYIYNMIIDYTDEIQKKHNNKDINITYYLNSFNKYAKIDYEESDKVHTNRFTYLKQMDKDYYNKSRCEYKFAHTLSFDKVEKLLNMDLNVVLDSVKEYYGCVLNFGNKHHFYVPYLDFIDDYNLVVKMGV